MGIIHSCDQQKGVVYIVWDGTVTWQAWQEHADALLKDPDWKQSSGFLVDLRSVTDTSSIGFDEVDEARNFFNRNQDLVAGKRGAVIAANEFRHAQHFGSLAAPSGISMVVFNGLDTACIFLGLDLIETSQELERLRVKLRGE